MPKQLNFQERQLIELWLQSEQTIRVIAKQLHRSPSSICDEIKRNSDLNGYHAVSAQATCDKRIGRARKQNSLKKDWIVDYVIRALRFGWSPEQIAGKLKRDHGRTIICHETIYRYIFSHPEKQLSQYLVRNHKRRKRKSSN